ncbi:MAG: hypothetical protein IMW91_10775 [Firmicutes bacterium]|nr:hypothetical protein [Bacillota bacterium]
MPSLLQEAMINVVALLGPVFVAWLFWREEIENVRRSKLLIGVSMGLSAILVALFPVHLLPTLVSDLGLLPIVFSTLYGGVGVGGCVFAVYLLTHLATGSAGAVASLSSAALIFLLSSAIFRRFRQGRSLQRLVAVAVLLVIGVAWVAAFAVAWPWFQALPDFNGVGLYAGVGEIVLGVLMVRQFEGQRGRYEARRREEENQRLRIVRDLAAGISHELRNPLTVVSGFIQVTLAQPGVSPSVRRNLQRSLEAVNEMEETLSDYLVLAQLENRQEPVAIDQVLECVATQLQPYATQHMVSIQVRSFGDCRVLGDVENVVHMVRHLARNGIEAMEEGGVLLMEACREGREVRLTVEDHGVGMSAAEVEHLGTVRYVNDEASTGLAWVLPLPKRCMPHARSSAFPGRVRPSRCVL